MLVFLKNSLQSWRGWLESMVKKSSLHGKKYFRHWEALDIDVELDALENPEKYPLIYRDFGHK